MAFFGLLPGLLGDLRAEYAAGNRAVLELRTDATFVRRACAEAGLDLSHPDLSRALRWHFARDRGGRTDDHAMNDMINLLRVVEGDSPDLRAQFRHLRDIVNAEVERKGWFVPLRKRAIRTAAYGVAAAYILAFGPLNGAANAEYD
jgi:hypothetical protein